MTDSTSRRGQTILWRLEALAYEAADFLARIFPIDAVSDFGAWFFRTFGPLTSPHRVAETNLRIAFPSASDAEIARLLDEQWDHLGRWAAEFPILDRIIADPARVEVVGAERLAAIRDGAGPVVFISGHFSSFEIMPAVILHSGINCWITGRATNNPYVDAIIRKSRARYGVRQFAPKGAKGTRDLLRALGRGECVALITDPTFHGGVAAPLFSVMAHTAPGLFLVLRWAAIAYLFWLGFQTWRSHVTLAASAQGPRIGIRRGFAGAMALQLSNPKAFVFFTVFLPPFVDLKHPVAPQLVLLASIGVVMEVAALTMYGLLAYRMGQMAMSRRAERLMARISGAILMSIAVAMALSHSG